MCIYMWYIERFGNILWSEIVSYFVSRFLKIKGTIFCNRTIIYPPRERQCWKKGELSRNRIGKAYMPTLIQHCCGNNLGYKRHVLSQLQVDLRSFFQVEVGLPFCFTGAARGQMLMVCTRYPGSWCRDASRFKKHADSSNFTNDSLNASSGDILHLR
jgi:hypothetical protein